MEHFDISAVHEKQDLFVCFCIKNCIGIWGENLSSVGVLQPPTPLLVVCAANHSGVVLLLCAFVVFATTRNMGQISTFVVRCLDSMILAISKISKFSLAFVAEQTGLNLSWLKITEDTFSRDVTHIMLSLAFLLVLMFFQSCWHCGRLAWRGWGESWCMCFSCICIFIMHASFFVFFSSSWCWGLAADCECGTPWSLQPCQKHCLF